MRVNAEELKRSDGAKHHDEWVDQMETIHR